MTNVSEWSTTAASNNTASPDGFPEGMPPAGLNDSAREVMAAIAKWYQDLRGGLTSTGTPAAYTLTSNNSHAALSDVPLTVFIAHTASTAAPTLNIDSTGAKTLKKRHDVSLAAGDIEAGQVCIVARNSTDDTYELLNPTGGETDVQKLFSARGDILVSATAGTATALAIGATGTTLTSNGLDAAWSSVGASQAEMESGASGTVYVTPSVAQHHPSAAKAWCVFDGTLTGTNAPSAGYGVTSVTRNGTGDYTINFSVTFSSANYALVGSHGPRNGTHGRDIRGYSSDSAGTAYATTSARVESWNLGNSSREDAETVHVMVFGDL